MSRKVRGRTERKRANPQRKIPDLDQPERFSIQVDEVDRVTQRDMQLTPLQMEKRGIAVSKEK